MGADLGQGRYRNGTLVAERHKADDVTSHITATRVASAWQETKCCVTTR
jgi:hypothetical protein